MNTLVGDPVQALRPQVQQALDRFLAHQRHLLTTASPDLGPLVDAAAELLCGGKRLRPAFCYWGWRGAGAAHDNSIVTAGAALELFQAAALVHDDLIDGSDTRRGRPAAHRRFAATHRDAGWSGDSDAFGSAAAVLLGDILLGWSDELLSSSGLSDDALRRARPIYERMRTEVGAGQYLDVLEQASARLRTAGQADRARQVIRYKAARYSVERPLLFGGSAAGAEPEVLEAYSRYGLALGEAFQLRDDVLGVFGDPGSTGKPAGDDLREGKRTVLMAYALETAGPEQRTLVDQLLGDPGLQSEGIDALRDVLVTTGALARVENLVAELVDAAHEALATAPLDDESHRALATLIDVATVRTT